MRGLVRFVFVVVMGCLLCGIGVGQVTTGSISGTVKDPTGAVVPNAKVTITDSDKNVAVRSANSNGSGEFSFASLPVGRYSVGVEASGFQKYVQTGITLNVNDTLTVFAVMKVGAPSETVSVEASAVQVNLENATATGVVSGTQIRELAMTSRNYMELVELVPGTSNSGNSDQLFPGATAPLGTNLASIQVNGNRREENNWLVDGADNVDRGSNLTLLSFPSVDAIAEFRVVRGVYDAESGRSAGAQINVITRSGTSTFHGGAYEFFRNDVLNANNYFNKQAQFSKGQPNKPPALRYNDFGGTIGGPVWIPKIYEQKNKTFFFFSDEARRVVTYSNPTASVLLPGMISGNFQHTVCTKFANSGGTAGQCQAYGTSIPQTQWDPVAAAYVKDIFSLYPTPNAGTAANPFSYVASLRGLFNFREDMIKVDHIFGPKLTVNGKYLHDTNPTREAGGLFLNMPLDNIATTSTSSPGHQYNLAATLTLSPTLLVDGGYRYSYGAIINQSVGAINFNNSPDIKAAVGNTLPFTNTLGRVPAVNFPTGTLTAGLSPTAPYNDFNVNNTVYSNLTKVIGNHTLRFGGIFYHYNKHENQLSGSNNGSYTFDAVNAPTAATAGGVCTGTAATGGTCPFSLEQAWANFLQGQLSTFSQASIDVTANIFDNQFEYYGQDTWHLRPNLTVTYGIRHSFFRQPTDASGPNGTSELSNFDPAFYNPAQAPCITSTGVNDVKLVNGLPTTSACNPNYNPLNGFIYANPPTFDGFTGTKSPFGSKVGKEFNAAVAPRIGVAWDPFGKGTTSVRAGYGMFYDNGLEFGNPELNVGLNPGFLQNLSITRSTLSSPVGTTTVAATQTPPSINARMPINYMSPYSQQWSLDIQHLFQQNWFFDIGYFGSNGIHLPGIIDPNQPAAAAYLNCTTANKCFAGPTAVAANGVDISTGCPTSQPCVNGTTNTTKLNVLRPFTGYGPETGFLDIYTSNYHSLQTQLQRKFSGNTLVNISYTWSHGLTTDPADRSTGGANLPQIPTDLRNNYGPTVADRRNVLTANFVWELPWLREQHGFVGHALGGWEFSGVQTFQSGLPLTATIGNAGCNAGTGTNCFDAIGSACFGATPIGCRVNQIGDPNSGATHSFTNYFNAAVFQPAPAGQTTEPTERPGAIRAPGYWVTDLSLFKNIKFTERFTGQFRLESFNTFNHTNPICCASQSFASTAFNTVTSTRDPRLVQAAIKFNF